MIAVIVPRGDDRLFGALLCQKEKGFKVYIPEDDTLASVYEQELPIVKGGLSDVQEPYVWILEQGALPDQDFIRRAAHTIDRHPEFDVYHANLAVGEEFPRVLKKEKLFRKLVLENCPAPLSSCVFVTSVLKEKAVFRADGSIDPLPTLLACGSDRGLRNIRKLQLVWTAPSRPTDPASAERQVRDRLDFLRWTESFYGEDYPLGTGGRLDLVAGELAKLFPSYSEDALKEQMHGFQVATGAVRKMRATSALKSALKARQQELK
mgnify:CR=1 FL=1